MIKFMSSDKKINVELKMEGYVFTSFRGLSGHSSTETKNIYKFILKKIKIDGKQKTEREVIESL